MDTTATKGTEMTVETGTWIVSEAAIGLIREALASEIEHTNDMVREMPDITADDIEAIHVERIRQDRLEAILSELS